MKPWERFLWRAWLLMLVVVLAVLAWSLIGIQIVEVEPS